MADETLPEPAGENPPAVPAADAPATKKEPEPPREITEEEWIAASQSCCGAE